MEEQLNDIEVNIMEDGLAKFWTITHTYRNFVSANELLQAARGVYIMGKAGFANFRIKTQKKGICQG